MNTPLPENDILSGAVNKLLEHPELISAVASTLGKSGVADALQGTSNTKTDVSPSTDENTVPTSQNVPPDIMASLAPMLTKLGGLSNAAGAGAGGASFRHSALLCALKPYLSRERAQAIDYIIKFSQMSSLIKTVNKN